MKDLGRRGEVGGVVICVFDDRFVGNCDRVGQVDVAERGVGGGESC